MTVSPFADAVIVAAGNASRMAGIDKLEADLAGRPLLQWSVDSLVAAHSIERVIVVVRPERVDHFRRKAWLAGATVVEGGEVRADSVRAGVAASGAEVVLVHDGARPFVSTALADTVADAARKHGAAVPTLPVVDSLKEINGTVLGQPVERAGLVRAQTPQGARRELLLECFAGAGGGAGAFTDEAGLLASRGVEVVAVAGEATNLKVTEPADLELARTIATGRSGALNFGFGQDSHPFGPSDGLWLGGVQFEGAPRLYGHSDGDVALHALATAILAACGLGDLGRLFPASDGTTVGIASADMLAQVLDQVSVAGWQVARAQVALLGARPKLGSVGLDAMRARIAHLIGLDVTQVAVTASSGNLSGAEGAGRSMSATALVGVHRR